MKPFEEWGFLSKDEDGTFNPTLMNGPHLRYLQALAGKRGEETWQGDVEKWRGNQRGRVMWQAKFINKFVVLLLKLSIKQKWEARSRGIWRQASA